MRNLKKFLALVLASLMILSVAVISTGAAEKGDYTEAAQHLASLQVMKGNEKGDLMLENGVTRYQAALFFVQALTGETDVATWNAEKKSANFTDVPEYGTAIDYAYGIGIVAGRGNGIFGYNDAIMYQDMLVMGVRALGYETEDMAYPYGYILAAQKLGLTDNVDQVNYKAALTRGETAQIIWDMLGTEVAVIDPLTDKILYPGETGLTDAILGENNQPVEERKTLLEESGLAGGKLEAYVTEFVEADEDDEESVDTVIVWTEENNEFELAAADLGITAETRKINYLGLPVDLYIDVNEEDFTQADYEDGDANIVMASFPEFKTVTNIGDAGNIKYVENTTDDSKSYFSFGGEKFTNAKNAFGVYTFTEDGWVWAEANLATLEAAFNYTTKDGYNNADAPAVNPYGEVSYLVEDAPEDAGVDYLVYILYTPYEFGQYNVREINDNKYTVIGTYNATAAENLDEVMSNFVEWTVDGSTKVTSATKKISASKGEAAMTVTVEGEEVQAGDFMFYAYNEVDNVLTVAGVAGALQSGRLTAQNTTKETVKISGTSYDFGFEGAFASTPATFADYAADIKTDYIEALEAGKDNVEFILVNGNIVFMQPCSETSNGSTFDYAIISTDAELMADLLDITDAKYAEALTAGLYVEDGVVKVAMMNLATGEWELASVKTVAANWDETEDEFVNEYTVATLAEQYDIVGESYTKKAQFNASKAVLELNLVAVVAEADGVYTIADNEADFFVYGDTDDGILFSDNSTKTNAITADNDVDEARVNLDAETVIVVVSADGVGARVGVQKYENSFAVAEGYFLSANSDLIVLVSADETPAVDVLDWADAATANSDENWYITTVDTGIEVEANDADEDTFIVTITDVYDMKAQAIVDSIQTEAAKDADILEIAGAGQLLFKNAQGEIDFARETLAQAAVEVANDNEDKLEYTALATLTGFEFASADTVIIPDVVDAAEAVDVNVTVVTLDQTGLDVADYDWTEVVLNKEWNDATDLNNEYNVGDVTVKYADGEKTYWAYELDTDLINEITEPTEGVFDQYVVDMVNETILVPADDSSDYADAMEVEVELTVVYSLEDSVLNIVVYKEINLVAAN